MNDFFICCFVEPSEPDLDQSVRSILPGFHDAIMDNVVYHGTVIADGRQQQPLSTPSTLGLLQSSRIRLISTTILESKLWNFSESIEDVSEFPQAPFLP